MGFVTDIMLEFNNVSTTALRNYIFTYLELEECSSVIDKDEIKRTLSTEGRPPVLRIFWARGPGPR